MMASRLQYRYLSTTFRVSPSSSNLTSYSGPLGQGFGCGPNVSYLVALSFLCVTVLLSHSEITET